MESLVLDDCASPLPHLEALLELVESLLPFAPAETRVNVRVAASQLADRAGLAMQRWWTTGFRFGVEIAESSARMAFVREELRAAQAEARASCAEAQVAALLDLILLNVLGNDGGARVH